MDRKEIDNYIITNTGIEFNDLPQVDYIYYKNIVPTHGKKQYKFNPVHQLEHLYYKNIHPNYCTDKKIV